MRRRAVAGALAACLLLAGASGCSSDDSKAASMKISGDCALGDSKLPITQLLPESLIARLVGPGDYKITSGLVVKDGKLPAAYDGTCALDDGDDGDNVLHLAVYNRKDESYARAKQMLAAGDASGFQKIDDSTFVLDDAGEGAAQAWKILPDRIIILRVLRPKKGVDAAKEVGPAMAELTTRVQAISGR